jgi:hypothetical protein
VGKLRDEYHFIPLSAAELAEIDSWVVFRHRAVDLE